MQELSRHNPSLCPGQSLWAHRVFARVKQHLRAVRRRKQSGVIPHRSTVDRIATLKLILQRRREIRKPSLIACIYGRFWATSNCFIQGEVIGFQVLLDSLHPRSIRGHPGGLLQFSKRKLLRFSRHLLRLAFAHCGGTGRNAMLGQQPKGVVARLSVSPHHSK